MPGGRKLVCAFSTLLLYALLPRTWHIIVYKTSDNHRKPARRQWESPDEDEDVGYINT